MRKADYAALARLIKLGREDASKQRDASLQPDPNYWHGWHSALYDIAYKFAETASVDKDQFLKACGIDP